MPQFHKTAGQGPIQSQTLHRLAKASTLVQRLNHRCLTRQSLRIVTHQRFGFKVHFVWNGDGYGDRNMRFFERLFLTYADLSEFCITLGMGAAEGLCNCVAVREGCFAISVKHLDMMYSKLAFCGGCPLPSTGTEYP